MKKVVNVTTIIYILLLFYITNGEDILTLTISFSTYILLNSIFSSIKIAKDNYKEVKISIIGILLLFIPIILLSYLLGELLSIDNLGIVNIVMTCTLMFNIIQKLLKEYLEVIGYKKINNIMQLQKIITNILKSLLLILLFKVIDIKEYLCIIILYSINMITSIGIIILFIKCILKNNKKKNKEKINIIKDIKNIKTILISDATEVIYNIVNSAYIYISIIVLYFALSNKYNYSYENISSSITNTYFYGLIVIYYIYQIIKKYLNIDIKTNFSNNLNKIIKILLPISILLTIISNPLSNIIFNSNKNILIGLMPLLFVYVFYDFIMNIIMQYKGNKKTNIILIISLMIKIIFELPLINTIYRMGYSLELGSILSTVLGLILSIILGTILIKNKQKLSLLDNFNNLLNIIYENIIYTLILVLFTFIVKIHTNTFVNSLLVVLFYLFITVLFYILRRILTKK